MARAAQQAAVMLIARTISVVSVYLWSTGVPAYRLQAINGVHVLTFRAGMDFTTVYMQCCI